MILRRFSAYLIDIIIVTLVSTFLTSNSYINKDYKKYLDTYDEYTTYYDDYVESRNKIEEEKENITNEEYDQKIQELDTDYITNIMDYDYKLTKLSFVPNFINILCILLYFVVIQFYFGGITLGKKIMKLKVESNNGKNLTIFNYFVRCLVLNGVFFNIISMVYLLVLSKNSYFIYNELIYILNYITQLAIIFTCLFVKKNRGLHDIIANTVVVSTKEVEHEM